MALVFNIYILPNEAILHPVGTFLDQYLIGQTFFMKRFFTLLTVTVILSSFSFSTGIENIVAALKGGNASQVARYFDNTVEITLPDKSNSYSKSQAEMILRDFFTNNPIKGFDVIHKGENAGSQYCIGTLFTKNASFRTTVFMKTKDGKQLVKEIRFQAN